MGRGYPQEMAFFFSFAGWVCCGHVVFKNTNSYDWIIVLGRGSNHILLYLRVFVKTMLFWPVSYYLSQNDAAVYFVDPLEFLKDDFMWYMIMIWLCVQIFVNSTSGYRVRWCNVPSEWVGVSWFQRFLMSMVFSMLFRLLIVENIVLSIYKGLCF